MTQRLLMIGQERWADIDGYAAGHGIELDDLSLSRFCNFVWWWLTREAPQSEVDKFRARLWRPPAGEVVTHKASPWNPENENQAFAQLKQALTGSSKSSK